MPTLSTTLWSTKVLKDWLGTTQGNPVLEAELELLADGVTALLERETGRIFVTRSFTEIRDGSGGYDLWLQQWPVIAINSITVLRSPGDLVGEVVAATSYHVAKDRGHIRLHNDRFSRGLANVTVVYTAGYGEQDAAGLRAPGPSGCGDAWLLGLDVMKFLADQKRSGATAASQISIGPATFIVKPDWPLHIRMGLKNLRRSDV